MKFYLIIAFGCVILLASCKQKSGGNKSIIEPIQKGADQTTNLKQIQKDSIDFFNNLVGEYSGKFGNNSILLNIRYVGERSVVGYNKVKNLRRNVYGYFEASDSGYSVYLKEPGDNEYDGEFRLFFSTKKKGTITGIWKPYNTAKLNTKYFNLEKLDYYDETIPIHDDDTLGVLTFAEYYLMIDRTEERGKNYNLIFDKNGTLQWKYYKDFDDDKAQMTTVNGSWRIENGLVHIRIPYDDFFQSSDVYAKVKFSYNTENQSQSTDFYEKINADETQLIISDSLKFEVYWLP